MTSISDPQMKSLMTLLINNNVQIHIAGQAISLIFMSSIHGHYHRSFMEAFFKQTLDYVQETLRGTKPVINFSLPDQLKKIVDFTIGDEPTSQEELLKQCRLIMENQMRPYHPHFHNQLFGGFDEYSIIGSIMTNCMNGTMYTYEVAPCFSLMEQEVFEHMRKRIGWDFIDGIMTPGGSFANWNGMLLARYHRFPESKVKGIQGLPKIKIITSAASHYSVEKGAILEGYGLDNIVKVKCTENGEMIPEDLDEKIKGILDMGEIPLMVNATVGTTVSGAIDPIEEIGRICKKYKVWLHVDAALGGAFWLSDKLTTRIGNCTDVDSVTWDPHKALVVPLQATLFLCRHPGLMEKSNSTKADYLFHKERDSYNVSLDTGDRSLQCGRVIDILKCWTYFKGNGWREIARHIEREHELAQYLTSRITESPEEWVLIYPATTINVSYYYIPKAMAGQERNQSFYETLSKVTVLAKKLMISEGRMLVGYATNGKDNNYFWRNVMSNPFITNEHVDEQLKMTIGYCKQAWQLLNPPS